MQSRVSIDEVGLLIATAWSLRGTCARRRVGCLLVDAAGFELASGYNGPASGEVHCVDHHCPGVGLTSGTGLDECEALHAEWNALSRCADVRAIHTCYVTSSPCVTCVKMLLNTGCRRIVFAERYAHDDQARALWTRPRPDHVTDHSLVKGAAPREWIEAPRARFAIAGLDWGVDDASVELTFKDGKMVKARTV